MQLFLTNFDTARLLELLRSVGAAVICLTVHELCHGLAAYTLGDDTARRMGRLSLNPLRHIDLFGLLALVTAGVGWAKPVPADLRNFKHPRRDMALTALAGPVSNMLLAALIFLLCRGLLALAPLAPEVAYYGLLFLVRVGVLSVGLGLFNLIPVPPLDGSKVLFSLLPRRLYYGILRWEKYGMVALIALIWFGVLDRPLGLMIHWAVRILCRLVGFPDLLVWTFL